METLREEYDLQGFILQQVETQLVNGILYRFHFSNRDGVMMIFTVLANFDGTYEEPEQQVIRPQIQPPVQP